MKKILFLIIVIFYSQSLFAGATSSVQLGNTSDIKSDEIYEIISGFSIFPSAYRQDKNKGFGLDFSINNIIGEIVGSRTKKKQTEFTNPVMMSIVTLTGKWSFLKETNKKPAMSVGTLFSMAFDLGNEINSDVDYQDINRSSTSLGFFLNVGKTIKKSKITLGFVSSGYSKIFSNYIQYYDSKDAAIIYSGLNFDYKKIKFNLEIIKPLDSEQSPFIINLRPLKKLPILVFSFINTNQGKSILAIINLRIPVYPPYTSDDLKKRNEKFKEKENFKNNQKKVKNIKLDF